MKGRSTSPGKTRDGRAAIDPVAEPHEALLTDENPQYARNPILAAEVPEFPTHQKPDTSQTWAHSKVVVVAACVNEANGLV